MSGGGGFHQMDLPFLPINLRVVFSEPGISQDDVILSSQIQNIEILDCFSILDLKREPSLVLDHFSSLVSHLHFGCTWISGVWQVATSFSWLGGGQCKR